MSITSGRKCWPILNEAGAVLNNEASLRSVPKGCADNSSAESSDWLDWEDRRRRFEAGFPIAHAGTG